MRTLSSPRHGNFREGLCGPKHMSSYIAILLLIVSVCAIVLVGELSALVSLASKTPSIDSFVNPSGYTRSASGSGSKDGNMNIFSRSVPSQLPPIINRGENVCQGKDPGIPSAECIIDAMINVGPQAGANITAGYQGNMLVDHGPITTPFWMNGMCPVNVHWHMGAEHLSVGQYDENGIGPSMETTEGEVRQGHQCHFYDDNDPKFTRPYEWQHCKGMEVGQTYEVHWPHSAAGACGTPNQYQTPFQDGVFCIDGILDDTASQVGVQSQVFVVVNDDTYFWPDLIRGMIVDGEMGSDVAKYTGSTTGTNFDNDICSQYSPITWHVDRKCHLISATSFDKLCYDMLLQRDDMSGDIDPHGSRETVKDDLAANNQVRKIRG